MWNKIKIRKIIKNLDNIYAHKTFNRHETLFEHSERTIKIFENIDKKNNYDKILDRIIDMFELCHKGRKIGKLSNESKELIKKMFYNAIYLHDIGKINPYFQIEKMENELIIKFKIANLTSMETNHSFLSTALYLDIFYPETMTVKNPIEKIFVQYLMLAFSHIIYTHHEDLFNMENLFNEDNFNLKVLKPIEDYKYDYFYNGGMSLSKNLFKIVDKIKDNNITFDGQTVVVLTKILQSLIISCDFTSTYQFFSNIKETDIDIGTIDDINAVYDKYKSSDIYKSIEGYKNSGRNPAYFKSSPINALRSDMFLEVEENLMKNLLSAIHNLQMPTGSGKSNTGINLSLKLVEQTDVNKIFYAFPFNALVDQTKATFQKLFGDVLEYETVNSLTPITERKNESGDTDYSKTLLDRQLMNYPVVLTSNVKLFNMLFGTGRIDSMPLFQLANSVIVLDEIQSYKNTIWREIIEFLYKYSEALNIKIIIMSATLPNLQELIGFKKNDFIDLIPNPKKYYKNPLFLKRVTKDYTLLDIIDMKLPRLKLEITKAVNLRNVTEEYSKVLVEFIKKERAKEFIKDYQKELEKEGFVVLELTGDDSSYERERILRIIKSAKNQNIVLISTQVIEAGVDIDMEIGFKDTSLLDNDEQFAGRINRSCLKHNCIVYYFNLDAEKSIYKGDLRLGKNLKDKKYQEYLTNVDMKPYYRENFEKINILNNELNMKNSFNEFYKDLMFLRYKKIEERMKLICNETFDIFIPFKLNKEIVDDKGNITGYELVDGKEVWNEYIALLEDTTIKYAEKKVNLAKMREVMSLFTYSIYGKGLMGLIDLSGLYYIENGEKFINKEKFNRQLFEESYVILK